MSKISLSPDSNGTGIFTIASPNSNTNRTLTLPDDSGTIVTNSGNQAGSFTTLNTSGAVVFNDAGANVDFRVEGDTDANLLFVDASTDRVGIGVAPDAKFRVNAGALGGLYIAFNGLSQNYYDSNSHNFRDGSANVTMTLDANGNLDVEGGIKFNSDQYNGKGLGFISSYTFNNNSANSIGGGNSGFQIIYIYQGNGSTAIPFFANAGGGVLWSGSIFDPDAGSFTYGGNKTINFATVGTGANSYALAFDGNTANITIQRTAGSAAYTVVRCEIGA